MSRDEGGFRMVPVAVGVDFGTTNSVVAIADRSGQVQVRRFDTQVGVVEAYRSALLFFREGRPPKATLSHISGPDALLRAMDIDTDHRLRIPTQSGRGFRFDVGHRSDLIPATIPK
jgi:molecular chaperone DnaK (HSP70)